MSKEEKKYSKWEYEEEKPDQDEDDPNKDPNANPDDPNGDDPSKASVSDDTAVEIEVDGKKETVLLSELKSGYMRQSDYTRKTQELAEKLKTATPAQQQQTVNKAQEVVDNPDEFSPEDVKAAEILLSIGKKKFGLMTREEYDAEEAKKKQVAEFGTRLDSAKSKVSEMKGMPAWDEEKVLSHMQETGIHDAYAAYLNMNDAAYRDFIIKQAKGDTSYKSDKGGKKVEPNDKPVDVRTEEGHRSFLSDEIKKLNDK